MKLTIYLYYYGCIDIDFLGARKSPTIYWRPDTQIVFAFSLFLFHLGSSYSILIVFPLIFYPFPEIFSSLDNFPLFFWKFV